MQEKEAEEAAARELAIANGDSIPERTVVTADEEKPVAKTRTSKRSGRKKSSDSASSASKKKPSTPKVSQPKSSSAASNSNAAKSVRRRKR